MAGFHPLPGTRCLALAAAITVSSLSAVLAGEGGQRGDTLAYESLAVDQSTGKPLYQEAHVERSLEGRPAFLHTRFLRTGGEAFAERTLDFTATPFTPTYRFEDFRTGWEEGAAVEAGGIRVYCRKGRGKPRREKVLQVPGPAVIDGGFNAFLKHHREALARGERLEFQFVVPSRLDWYRFVAFRRGGGTEESGKQMIFVAEPESRVLRLLAPRIQVTYDPSTGRMIEYQGISNVAAEGGDNQYIRLTYTGGGP